MQVKLKVGAQMLEFWRRSHVRIPLWQCLLQSTPVLFRKVEKPLEERDKGCVVHMLIPQATNTATWRDLVFPKASQLILLRRYTPYLRVNDGQTVVMPSCIVTFDMGRLS